MPPITALPRLPATDWSSAYGGRPGTPNPISTQGNAIGGNIGNLGQLYNLSRNVNQFNTAQAAQQYASNLPGYSNMLSASSANIQQGLHGQLQNDVVNQILNSAAARGLSAGGGANTNAAFLAAIGRNSYQQQQDAEQNLTQAIQRTPTAQLFNPASFFVSPEQQQAAAMHASNVAAAPVPSAAAAAAQHAANQGLHAGASSVGGLMNPMQGYGGRSAWDTPLQGPQTIVGNSTGTGTVTGGGTDYPVNYNSWNNWAQGLSHPASMGPSGETEQDYLDWLGWDSSMGSGGFGGSGTDTAQNFEDEFWG